MQRAAGSKNIDAQMIRLPGTSRPSLLALALAGVLSSCVTYPDREVPITPESAVLAVDVRYWVPWGFDPSLVQALFVRGPIHTGMEALPELIPATLVTGSP